jgi:Transglycosylase SLT domain
MTRALVLGLALLLILALPAELRAEADPETQHLLCEQAIVNGARRGGVPVEVLHAVALTETGKKAGGRIRPWPWAINREGKGHWFETRADALAFARQSLADGRKSFDVGCVQINFRWHGHAFPSIEDMLDPEWTATYAAQFLRTLYEERGSWSEAAGAYHSLTPKYSSIYRERFDRILAGLSPDALTGAEALLAEAMPEDGRSTRLAQRGAERHALALRLREGPPPAPVMGSIAAAALMPAAGALLGQAQPLISAAPGSLF